jgi:hypothetical protein
MGDGTFETEFVNFYDLGVKQVTQLEIRASFQGTGEITVFSFIGKTPTILDGTYATIYDEVGSVGILFRLDGGSTGTSGAARDIIVDIVTGDNVTELANKTAVTLNSDSKFTGSDSSGLCILQSSTLGNKTNATAGDSTLGVSIQDGADTLNDQYFYIFSANDTTEYYVWFNFNSTGTDPNIAGKTGIEVPFVISDTLVDISERITLLIGALDGFTTNYEGCIYITNYQIGTSTDSIDVNSGSSISTNVAGSTGDLVARVQVFFDSDNIIISIERVV